MKSRCRQTLINYFIKPWVQRPIQYFLQVLTKIKDQVEPDAQPRADLCNGTNRTNRKPATAPGTNRKPATASPSAKQE